MVCMPVQGCPIIGCHRLVLGGEQAQVNLASPVKDIRPPPACGAVPTNTSPLGGLIECCLAAKGFRHLFQRQPCEILGVLCVFFEREIQPGCITPAKQCRSVKGCCRLFLSGIPSQGISAIVEENLCQPLTCETVRGDTSEPMASGPAGTGWFSTYFCHQIFPRQPCKILHFHQVIVGGEIQPCIGPIPQDRHFVKGCGGLLLGGVQSQVVHETIEIDLCSPLACGVMSGNSSVFGREGAFAGGPLCAYDLHHLVQRFICK
mmetsp:Transcript_20598/g.62025  ORF Transcript_20598/g.62025 Transcript_20598/m.62025 type:complete len:261 (+) Transcript_20598:2140-2922(+)